MRRLWVTCLLTILLASPAIANARDRLQTFRLAYAIGRGHVQSLAWHPIDNVIMVSTIRGAWFYDSMLRDLGHIEAARLAVLSPDGTLVAGVDAKNRIALWDGHSYAPVATLPAHDALITALAWDSTGNQWATGDQRGHVVVWDVEERRATSSWQVSSVPTLLRWSPDGSHLAVLSTENELQIWNLKAERMILDLGCCSRDIVWVNNTELARTGMDEGADRNVWDVETGKRVPYGPYLGDLPPLSIRLAWAGLASVSNDATMIATTDRWLHPTISAPIYIKEISDVESTYTLAGDIELAGHYHAVEFMAWNSTDSLLASAGIYGDLRVWKVDTSELVASNETGHTLSVPFRPYWLSMMNSVIYGLPAWSPDGQLLAVPDNLHTVEIWDMKTHVAVASLSEHEIRVVQIAWHPDSELVATTTGWPIPGDSDLLVRIWDAPSGTLIDQYEHSYPAIAWRPDGSILVSAADANTLSVWQTARRQLGEPLTISDLSRVDFVERVFAEGLEWDATGNNLIVHYSSNLGHRVATYRFPDIMGETMISTHSHLSVCTQSAWNTSGTQQYVARWFCPAQHVETSDDDHNIEIAIYSLDARSLDARDVPSYDPSRIVELTGHTDVVEAVALSPGGQYLMSTSQDRTSRLWTSDSGKASVILPYLEHVAWSPDSDYIAGFNENARGWLVIDRDTKEVIQHIPLLSNNQGYLVWSPDGQTIVHIVDGVAFIWEQ